MILSIDRQLAGLDIGKIVEEKEGYIVEKGVKEIQKAVEEGLLTYEEITAVCLYRIKTIDQKEKGYNSVICVNPRAIDEARKKDMERGKNQEHQCLWYALQRRNRCVFRLLSSLGRRISKGAEGGGSGYSG